MNLRKVIKISFIAFGVFALLVAIWTLLISSPKVQTFITQRVTKVLSNQLNTKISIQKVHIEFFSKVIIENIVIEDQQGDTMIAARQINANIGIIRLLQKKIRIRQLNISKPSVYFSRKVGSESWNHDFLFKGDTTSTQKVVDTSNSFSWDIFVDQLNLNGVAFELNDAAKFIHLDVSLPSGLFYFDDIGLKSKRLAISSAKMENALVRMTDMVEDTANLLDDGIKDGRILKGDFQIAYKNVNLINSNFIYRNLRKETNAEGLDFTDLDINNINLRVDEGGIIADTIRGDIKHLSCTDKSGFSITKLETDATVSTVGIECRDLLLITPNSQIENYLAFDYKSFDDFKSFEQRVKLNGQFENTLLSMNDINYFAKSLDKIAHNTIGLNGEIKGTIDNLKGRNLDITIGKRSQFAGNITLRGLPNFNETFINLKVNKLKTTRSDLNIIYPHINYPTNLASLGIITFTGRFDGFTNDFVTEGKFNTTIGNFKSDINLKVKDGKEKAKYSGNLAMTDFDLGKFVNNEKALGKVSINTNVFGSGMTLESVNATLKGNIASIIIKEYNYSDITLDGTFKQKQFNGFASIDDENLALDFKGLIDLNSTAPEFQFESNVKKANLSNLNLSKIEYILESRFNLNLSGNSIDEFEGSVGMYGTSLSNADQTYAIDTLRINAKQINQNIKEIELISDIAAAKASGDFNLVELGRAFQYFVSNYFDLGISDSVQLQFEQDFEFEAEIINSDNLTELIHPKMHNVKRANVKGKFNSALDQLQFQSTVGYINYDNFKIRMLSMNANSSSEKLEFSTHVETIHQKNNLVVENIDVLAKAQEKVIDFNVIAQGDTIANQINISGILAGSNDGISIRLDPSSVSLNDEVWSFSQNNLIEIAKDYLNTENLALQYRNQQIQLESVQVADKTNMDIVLKGIELENFSNFIKLSGTVVSGLANGIVNIDDLFDNTTFAANLDVNGLKINQDSIGLLKIKSDLNKAKKRINVNALLEGPRHYINANGYYSIDKAKKDLDVDIDIKYFALDILKDYLVKYVKRPTGNALGKLKLSGTTEQPLLTGELTLDSTYATVPVLETRYFLEREKFVFNNNHIAFNDIRFKDVDRNDAIANGRINHQHLKDFNLDLALETDEFQFLNTTFDDNEDFYGVAYAQGSVAFKGKFNDIYIYANATTRKNTKIYLPLDESGDVGEYTFYNFINSKKDTLEEDEEERKINDFHLTLDINVTPDAIIELIFDLEARDIIKGSGTSNLKIQWERYGDLSIYGTYLIEQGDYLFTLRNIINKNFEIKRGGTVTWTGDPYEAILNINAIYATKASPYDLIEEYLLESGDDQKIARAKKTERTNLNLILKGSLSKPDIDFDIDVIDPDPSIRNLIESKLQVIETSENELNKQVLGLMVLNRFLPTNSGIGSSNPQLLGSVTTTVSELISTQLSIYLTDAIGIFDPNLSLDVNYRSYDAGSEDADALATTRRELEVSLTRRFFNDRFSVTAGGNFDFGENNPDIDRTTGIAGDVQIEYDLTPDGRLRVKAFSESEYDVFDEANNNKAGVGISYNQEFNNLPELIDQIKKRKAVRKERRQKKREEKRAEQENEVAKMKDEEKMD